MKLVKFVSVLAVVVLLLMISCAGSPETPDVPAPTSTPDEIVPEPEPSPATPSPPRVEILSTSTYTHREGLMRGGHIYKGDFVHIVGEMKNLGEENVKVKKLTPVFYDKGGSAIDTPWHWLYPLSVLAPGQSSPFFVILLDEDAGREMVDYELTLDCEVTDEEPLLDLKLLSSTSYMEPMTAYDLYWIIGEYKNTGSRNIENVWIFATYYDAGGMVIGYNYAKAPMLTVLPGQKAPFAVSSQEYYIKLELPGDLVQRIASYELGFSYKIADEAPYREFEILSHSSQLTQEKIPIINEIQPVFEVLVEVKNVGGSEAQIVAVIVTFYDAYGVVVDACWGHGPRYAGNRIGGNLQIDDLSSGETVQFRVKIEGDRALKVADYSLQVACYRISD